MYMTDVDIKGGSYLLTGQVLIKAHRIKFKLFDKTQKTFGLVKTVHHEVQQHHRVGSPGYFSSGLPYTSYRRKIRH
jgi:hypothetical protein